MRGRGEKAEHAGRNQSGDREERGDEEKLRHDERIDSTAVVYTPNPFAIGCVKLAAHSAFGAIASMHADKTRNRAAMAIAFGVLRAFGGWVIGIPLFFVLM